MQLISNFREGRIRTSDHKIMSLNPKSVIINLSFLTDFYRVQVRPFPY